MMTSGSKPMSAIAPEWYAAPASWLGALGDPVQDVDVEPVLDASATLAPAHARTGDAAKLTGYLGDDDTFDRAIERFAGAYADQNEADCAAFSQAADEHRIAVQRGV